jgi:hypothetical protein
MACVIRSIRGSHLAGVLAGALVCGVLAGAAFGQEAPKIIEAVPPLGATDVDPNLTELTVTFDQDMAGGFSWTGGGPSYPETAGKPHWVDKRTCVLPVKLKPDCSYRLGINSPSHRNFRSAKGVSVEPARWEFRTASATPPDPEKQKAANVTAWKELGEAIDKRYSYRDLRGVDWVKRLAEFEARAAEARSTDAWVKVAAEALSPSKDLHIHLEYEGRSSGVTSRRIPGNWNDKAIAAAFPDIRVVNGTLAAGRSADGIGYLSVSELDMGAAADFDAVPEIMKGFMNTRALIIDLRANAGGSEPLGFKVAGWFTSERRLYMKHVYRDAASESGWSEVRERWFDPAGEGKYYAKPIIVLSGRKVMSSAESFLMMLKVCPSATVVGAPTYGSSGNPKATALSNGVKVYLPSWKSMTPDGTCIEGVGIMPDVVVDPPDEAFRSGDPVLEKALEVAREKAGE